MSGWLWAAFNMTATIAAWELVGYLLRRLRGTRRTVIPRGPVYWVANPVTDERTVYRGGEDQ